MRNYRTLALSLLVVSLPAFQGCSTEPQAHRKLAAADQGKDGAPAKDRGKLSLHLSADAVDSNAKKLTITLTQVISGTCGSTAVPISSPPEKPNGSGSSETIAQNSTTNSYPVADCARPIPMTDSAQARDGNDKATSHVMEADGCAYDEPQPMPVLTICTDDKQATEKPWTKTYEFEVSDKPIELSDIPAGDVTIDLQFLDAEGKVLEEGHGYATISPSRINTAVIDLYPVGGSGDLEIIVRRGWSGCDEGSSNTTAEGSGSTESSPDMSWACPAPIAKVKECKVGNKTYKIGESWQIKNDASCSQGCTCTEFGEVCSMQPCLATAR